MQKNAKGLSVTIPIDPNKKGPIQMLIYVTNSQETPIIRALIKLFYPVQNVKTSKFTFTVDRRCASHRFSYFQKSLENVLRWARAIRKEQIIVIESGLRETGSFKRVFHYFPKNAFMGNQAKYSSP